jgi:hypothetical protein
MSHPIAWFCLVLVACASAYGVQLTATAMKPSDSPSLIPSATFTQKVLIAAIDPVTGDRAQVECDAPSNSFVSDVVLVDPKDFAAVARECSGDDASAAHP